MVKQLNLLKFHLVCFKKDLVAGEQFHFCWSKCLLDTASAVTRLQLCQCYIVFLTRGVHETVNSELILILDDILFIYLC